ncbi:MAG: tetratricopeptide repeat protein [Alphaproteobacteria bacterium]
MPLFVAAPLPGLSLCRGANTPIDATVQEPMPHTPPTRDPITIARRLRDEGDLQGAMRMLEKMVRLPAHRIAALLDIGALLNTAGNFDQAQAAYREVLKTDPDNLAAQLGLADIQLSLSRTDEAKRLYLDLSVKHPDNADVHLGLGECALQTGDTDSADTSLTAANDLRPDDATIEFNLAQVRQMQNDLVAAESLYLSSLRRLEPGPTAATVWNKLGSLYSEQRNWEGAAKAFQNAVDLAPGFVSALNNLGEVMRELGDLEIAEQLFDQACKNDPDYVPAHFNRSLLRLLSGNYAEAWPDYDFRWKVPPLVDDPRTLTPPLWNGEKLAGKSIIVHAEQGIGDTIQFMRFLPQLVAMGAGARLALSPRLMHLASGLDGVTLTPLDTLSNQTADYHCPLMSVPGRLGVTLETIPRPAPIPAPSAELRKKWKDRLDRPGRNIGICWQGNPKAAADRGRSPPLAAFKPISENPNISLISLQVSDGLEQLDEVRGQIDILIQNSDFDAGSHAFADTIAVLEQVDLVITGDTAVAHLAASMGKPTWIALKHIPDWRWGLTGEICPWYPAASLFRQPSPGDWDSVFRAMADRL